MFGCDLFSYAQPIADFTSSLNTGCAPLIIQFTNTTTGTVHTWLWDFGNGNSSNLKNPAAIYSSPGIYPVTLIAADTVSGQSDTIKKNNFIVAFAPPEADFSADNTGGCAPFTVNFTDLSVPVSSSITEWYWDFGDGNKSTEKNPSHTYNEAGDFTVYLIVKDNNGCQDVFFIDKYIHVTKVTADFSSSNTTCISSPNIAFTNTSTGNNLTFLWDFDDGTNSTLQDVTHTFPSLPDSFFVKLIAVNDKNCRDTVVKKIEVINMNAGFSYMVSCADDTFQNTFTMNFTDLTVPASMFRYWDFDDGDTAMRQHPTHQFDALKPYNIHLVVGDGKGCVDTVIKTYIPPVADAILDTNYACGSLLDVIFTNNSSGTDSLNYLWDFDNGNISSNTNESQSYYVPDPIYIDTFFTKLVAKNKFGCADTTVDTISFYKINGDIVSNPNEGCVILPVQFISGYYSLEPIITYEWDFGDGNTLTNNGGNVMNNYLQHGLYDVSLIITNDKGCKDTVLKPEFIRVGISPDSIDFDATPYDIIDNYFYDTICHHRLDSFTAKVYFSDTTINANTFFWNFHCMPGKGFFYNYVPCEDSGFMEVHTYCATVPNPIHDYDEYGMFDSTYITVDGLWGVIMNINKFGPDTIGLIAGYNGCNDTIYKPIFIYPPTAMPGYIFPPDELTNNGFALASCSAPATFGFYNGSIMWDSLLFYTITNMQTGESWILDSLNQPLDSDTIYNGDTVETSRIIFNKIDSPNTTFIQFPKAGTYEILISVRNDTTRCIDVRNRMVAIDSVINGFSTVPEKSCLVNNKIAFLDTTKSFFGKRYLFFWDFGDGDTLFNGVPELTDSFSIYYCGQQNPYSYKECLLGYDGFDSIPDNDTAVNHGGRTIGTFNNPVHTYKDTGNYVVKSIVGVAVPYRINSSSKYNYLYCFYTAEDTVKINGLRGNFTADIINSCLGDTFSFMDSSVSTDVITFRNWNFGDTASGINNFSSLLNPQHIYSTPGIYPVKYIISDTVGCADSIVKSFEVLISKPKAVFLLPDSVCEGDSVSMINQSSGDSIFSIWEFGDISPLDSGFSPKHVFTSGNYTTIMQAIDSNNCRDTVNKDITVMTPPVIGFGADTVQADCQPLIVNFTDSSTGNISSYLWNFGDSSYSISKNPTHIYTYSDSFDVTLTITNSLGCSWSMTKPQFIIIDGPTGSFYAEQDTLCFSDSVVFISKTNNAFYYFWDFGDGNVEVLGPNELRDTMTHVYNLSGIFNPILLLYNGKQQCPNNISSQQSIYYERIQANFDPAVLLFCKLDTIDFYNATSSLFPITKYLWDWGDGTADSTSNNFIKHYYNKTGTYNITFLVSNITGCSDTVMKPVSVNESPELQIHPSDTIGCVPLSINFEAGSQIINLPDSLWTWDFGDGTKGIGDTVSHEFSKEGYFTVNLDVSYGQGGCMIDSSFVVQAVAVPKASFEIFPLNKECLTNSRFYFKNNTQDAVRYLWQFGNNSISSSENPDYIYSDSGKYLVKLIAYNMLNCADSAAASLVAYDNAILFTLPNVFTPYPTSPNQNDVFEIPGLPDNSSIKIYNRWGEKIFEENPYQNKWDGRDMKTNQPLEAGVYYYILSFCEEKVITGYVHLLSDK